MLADDVRKYVTGVLRSYFTNKSTLDKIGISGSGEMTFDGSEISANSVVSKQGNGLAPQLPNEETTTKFLRQDGTWAVPPDTDTNNAVTQTASFVNGEQYRVLLSYSADDTTRTEGVRKDTDFKYDPSTNTLIVGKITNTVIEDFVSSDVADGSASSWTTVSALATGETHASIFSKVSQMFKNIRFIYSILGTTDISSIGTGTVTNAIDSLDSRVSALEEAQSQALHITEPTE